MISIFDELMTDASEALMEAHCRPSAIRIAGNNGFRGLTFNAIVGNYRVEMVSDFDEGEWLAEKLTATVKAEDAGKRIRVRSELYVSSDPTPWTIVSVHDQDTALIRCELQRRYVADRSRARREATQ